MGTRFGLEGLSIGTRLGLDGPPIGTRLGLELLRGTDFGPEELPIVTKLGLEPSSECVPASEESEATFLIVSLCSGTSGRMMTSSEGLPDRMDDRCGPSS